MAKRPIKYQHALEGSNLKHLPVTFDYLISLIPTELIESVTAYQLSLIINTLFIAHRAGVHEGRLMET